MTHVPYRGSAAAVLGLLAGDIQFLIQSPEAVSKQIQAGKLRPLATLEARRLDAFPHVPIGELERELIALVKSADFAQTVKEQYFLPMGEGTKEFSRRTDDITIIDANALLWREAGKAGVAQKVVRRDAEREHFLGVIGVESFTRSGLHQHRGVATSFFLTGGLRLSGTDQGARGRHQSGGRHG